MLQTGTEDRVRRKDTILCENATSSTSIYSLQKNHDRVSKIHEGESADRLALETDRQMLEMDLRTLLS